MIPCQATKAADKEAADFDGREARADAIEAEKEAILADPRRWRELLTDDEADSIELRAMSLAERRIYNQRLRD